MNIADMMMMRWMFGLTRMDGIKNQELRKGFEVASLSTKLRENRLSWFIDVKRKTRNAPMRIMESLVKSRSGRPNRT